jgi:hypothetical protein
VFDKIANFDVAKLTLSGWLLFLVTTALLLGASFLLAFQAKDVADTALQNRASQRILGYTMLAFCVVFFVVVRKLLEKLGVVIYRADDNDSDMAP